jgi:hypothetical protein
MCPIPNDFRDRAISLYTVQTSNTPCPHTSCKVNWCWWWNFRKCIVTCKSIARQRPQHTQSNTQQWDNGVMLPVSRQRLGKHTSAQAQWRHTPTVLIYHVTRIFCVVCSRTVFSALSVPRLYNASPLAAKKSFNWVPRFQGDWRRSNKKTLYWFEALVSVVRSVARRRQMETENPSACATVGWRVCKSAIALY